MVTVEVVQCKVVVVVCALLAWLARSFQDPAARYFMALRGSQVTCRLFVSCPSFHLSGQAFLEVPWGDHEDARRLMP